MEEAANLINTQRKNKFPIFIYLIFLILFIAVVVLASVLIISKLPCRGYLGKPQFTGVVDQEKNLVRGDDNFSSIKVKSCILSLQKTDENEVVYKVGIFRDYFRMEKFDIRIGGKYPKVAVCNIDKDGKCKVINAQDITLNLKLKNIYSFYFVVVDKKSQLIETNSEYEKFMDSLTKLFKYRK